MLPSRECDALNHQACLASRAGITEPERLCSCACHRDEGDGGVRVPAVPYPPVGGAAVEVELPVGVGL